MAIRAIVPLTIFPHPTYGALVNRPPPAVVIIDSVSSNAQTRHKTITTLQHKTHTTMTKNIHQELADDYAGIATGAAQVSAEATALSMKHQFIASKDATVEAYHKAKDKLSDVAAGAKAKMNKENMAKATQNAKEKMSEAKEQTGEFFHKMGDKIKSATASALEKTADAADNLAARMR